MVLETLDGINMLQYVNRLSSAPEVVNDMKSVLKATNVDYTAATKRFITKNYNRRVSCPEVALRARKNSRQDEKALLDARVKINISGNIYETFYSTLARFPDTLLGDPVRRRDYFDHERQEYFFNRNRNAFDAILFYYQSNGLLTRPNNIRLQEFCEELKFFQINDETLTEFMRDEGAIEEGEEEVELPTNAILRKIWLWFEYPKLSKVSKLVATISVSFIAISIFVLCAETVVHENEGNTTSITDLEQFRKNRPAELTKLYSVLESLCIAWFTLEFSLRIVSCPDKVKFLFDFLNVIDLAAILPHYVQIVLGDSLSVSEKTDALRLLRVSRLFKLFRHLDELKVLAKTVRATWRELIMILFFIIITTAIFSGWTFYVEHEEQKDIFSSIPATSWFVIVSLTNVGYGDMVPVTVMGKLLGALCTLAGVLVIALPSPVIVTKFRLFYEKKKRKKLARYRF